MGFGADVEVVDQPAGVLAHPTTLREPPAPEAVEVLEDEVLLDGEARHDAASAVLGDSSEPGARRGPRGSLAVTSTPSTWMLPAVGVVVADSTWTSSVCPLPLTPATPTISPRATRRSTPSRRRAPSSSRSVRPRTSSAGTAAAALAAGSGGGSTSRGRRGVDRLGGADGGDVDLTVADHQGGDLGRVEPADRTRRHDAAAAQDRHAVGDGDDLTQLVRDEHDADALGAQSAHGAEQGVDVLGHEHGGGLVEDQHPTVAVQRLDDLDALALADRQRLDARVGIDVHADAGRRLTDGGTCGVAVHRTEADRCQHQVLGHRHRADERELLGDDADSTRHGIARRVHPGRHPADT